LLSIKRTVTYVSNNFSRWKHFGNFKITSFLNGILYFFNLSILGCSLCSAVFSLDGVRSLKKVACVTRTANCRILFERLENAWHFTKEFIQFRYVLCVQYSLKIEDKKVHFWHILLFFFRKELKATEAQREICGVYRGLGHKCWHLPPLVCALLFRRYKSRWCCPLWSSIHHWWWPNLPALDDARDCRVFQHCSYNSFATIKTIWDDEESRCLGPSRVDQKNILDRVKICESLLKLNSLEPFLKRVVIEDEKWIHNIWRKQSWCGPGESSQSVAKADLHPKKVMLSVGLARCPVLRASSVWSDYRC